MVYGIKGSREVKETETRKFLSTNSIDEVGHGCIRETFWWNGAVGRRTGKDSTDCEKRGDQ